MNATLSFEFALTCYLVAVIAGVIDLFKPGRAIGRMMVGITMLGFLVHASSIVFRYTLEGHLPISSPHEAASFFAWCVVLIFLVMEYRYSVGLLGSFIMPLVFVLMLTASMLPRSMEPLSPVLTSNWLGIHTVFAFLANASFAMAAGIAVMYLIHDHYLKSKHLGELFGRLPSVQTLDYLNYRLITVGFPLFTLAIISGAIWADSAWGSYCNWDPREVWALITWLIYATVLHARLLAGWRGKRAAVLTILGFVTILIAFFGIKMLQRGQHVF